MSKLNAIAMGLAVICLVACNSLPVQVSQDAGGSSSTTTKVVEVDGQKITIGSGAGYCLNERQSRYTRSGAFVVLAPCEEGDGTPAPKGLVIVNVLASQALQDALDADRMDEFFRSSDGRKALSARGNAADIEILGTMASDSSYVVHSRDASGPVIPDTSDEQWRMFFTVRDRLVSVSVINFTDAPMSDGQIFTQMEAIATTIRALNNP